MLRKLTLGLLVSMALDGVAQERKHNLMPVPATIEWRQGDFNLTQNFGISLEGEFAPRLEAEATRFLRRLDAKTGLFFSQNKVTGKSGASGMIIRVQRVGETRLYEDESYQLEITSGQVLLTAATDIGAIRGLETLLQWIQAGESAYFFPGAIIKDRPRFAWRGLMIDAARHFMPLHVLRRNIDAMAALKLNVLHLHLSDDQGFRFQSEIFPELTELASDGLFYTRQELTDLVAYADQKGIMIVPEIDVPGHATAILTVFPELGSKDTSYTLERFAGVFNPTLDPTNEKVYEFLSNLFQEIALVFPSHYIHVGGDENNGKHWDDNPEIRAFRKENGLSSNHELHGYFNLRLYEILSDMGVTMVGWEEVMSGQLPKEAIIHSWKGAWEDVTPKASLYEAAKKGHQAILSNGYYLDLMQPASSHYAMDPLPSEVQLSEAEKRRILGGEMCMWSELVIPSTIDSRLWPRGAAIAERFWSPEAVNDVEDMYRRLAVITRELEHLELEHITTPDAILRKLAAGHDTEPLEVLRSVTEPMKGYTRNPGGTMYRSYSPFTLWADAVLPEAWTAREFNKKVKAYLSETTGAEELRSMLTLWQGNHEKVLPIIERSPVLEEISRLSLHLADAAQVGLEALTFLETHETPRRQWIRKSREMLEAARESGGRTELQILTGLNLLVDRLEREAK